MFPAELPHRAHHAAPRVDVNTSLPTPSRSSSLTSHLPLLAALGFAWWLVSRVHWPHWETNPQYEFGQMIPFLCVILVYFRWGDRPVPTATHAFARVIAILFILGSIVSLAVIQPIFAANSDWRPLTHGAAIAGISGSLALIYLIGGRSWLIHFAFPFCLFLTAVPWPWAMENRVIQTLTERNAAFCVEVLQWSGYEAALQGSLIALPEGVLEVEQACSGVRSLQSSVALALIAGEICRITFSGRIILLAVGLTVAIVGNAVRIVLLSITASRDGIAAVDQLHDPAGYTILAATLTAVVIATRFLPSPPHRKPPASGDPPSAPSRPHRLRWTTSAAAGTIILFLAAIVGTEAWFRAHESAPRDPQALWTIPALNPTTSTSTSTPTPQSIDPRTLEILLHPDIALSERATTPQGTQTQLFYFRWEPGSSAVQSAMNVHDPRICLAAIGLKLEETLGLKLLSANGYTIPFQHFRFSGHGLTHDVFHSVVRDDDPTNFSAGAIESFSPLGRLRAVRDGRRNRGLSVLELVISHPNGTPDAERLAQETLSRRLRPLLPAVAVHQ